jgi:hypothetical protein
MKLHLSPTTGEWLECRAKDGNCPYSEVGHSDLQRLASRAVALDWLGEDMPIVKDTSGQRRTFEIFKDGSYKFGKRRYDSDGNLLPSVSTLRSRRARERAQQDALMNSK